MSGSAIRDWFKAISDGGSDWYKSGTIPGLGSQDAWTPFVNGWIYATAALLRSTPQAFRQALTDTDRWVQYSAQAKSMARMRSGTTSRPTTTSTVPPSSQVLVSTAPTTASASATDSTPTHTIGDYMEEDEDEPVRAPSTQPSTPRRAATSSNASLAALSSDPLQILDQFLNLGPTSTSSSQQQGKSDNQVTFRSKWPHDTKSDNNTMCLWSGSQEVIPCLCSNRRRPIAAETVLTYFEIGAKLSRECLLPVESAIDDESGTNAPSFSIGDDEGDDSKSTKPSKSSFDGKRGYNGVTFPLSEDCYPDLKPFYFGIDCRPEGERRLGQFPKVKPNTHSLSFCTMFTINLSYFLYVGIYRGFRIHFRFRRNFRVVGYADAAGLFSAFVYHWIGTRVLGAPV